MNHAITTNSLISFTFALLCLFIGKGVVARLEVLRRYSIPEALVGGVFCCVAVTILYYGIGLELSFDLQVRDVLLLYFFSTIGLNTNIRTLASGGRPLLMLTLLAICFMILQNIVGMSVAGLFGLDPRAGLMLGSISLTGGVGTTMAWTPYFTDVLGIHSATELGLAANMIGMIAACTIGGPIASVLMQRFGISR